MARKPVTRAKDKSSLSLAADHVILCSAGVASYAPYCIFAPGWLIGYDGVVASGYRVSEDLPGIAPHIETFRHALARAGNPFSLTVHPSKLTVSGNAVKVDVPTIRPELIPSVVPDSPRVTVAEPVREALIAASRVTRARNEHVITASVLLRSDSVIGTDGGTVLEAYHGGNMPGRWLLPTEFVAALEKIKHQPTHAGWSDETFTIWFGPNAWLRTNVYVDKYPDTDVIFAKMIADTQELRPVPVDMLLALETLKPFLVDTTITLWAQGFNTQPDGLGASYNFAHHMPPAPRTLPYDAMRYAGAHGDWVGYCRDGMYWYGKLVRGVTAAAI